MSIQFNAILGQDHDTPEVDIDLYKKKGRNKAGDLNVPRQFTREILTGPVENQGEVGSCVGMVVKSLVTETLETTQDLSAMFVYNMAKKIDYKKGEDYSGTSLWAGLRVIHYFGICKEEFMPHIPENENKEASKETMADALSRKSPRGQGAVLKVSDDEFEKKLMMILQEQCVGVAFKAHEEILNANEFGHMNETKYTSTKFLGGHVATLVGWKIEGDQIFWRFKNSWGTNYGQHGYFYMSNDLLKEVTDIIMFLIPEVKEAEPKPVEEKEYESSLARMIRLAIRGFKSIFLFWL